MNSNWSRLKRKLDENKHPHLLKNKRRRTDTSTSSKPSQQQQQREKHKSFMTKYANASSSKHNAFDQKIETYRKQTSKKQIFEAINLIPPPSTNNNMKERKAFWNELRLKLRARIPSELLFKLITPLSAQANSAKSSKLHSVLSTSKHTSIVALDCEMVGIGHNGNKSILARVSIVNYFGEVIFDKFVKPIKDAKCKKISDYRTEITGITKEDLVKYGITFEQAQREIIALLKGKKIIGHAIDNDFKAMQCSNILKKNFYDGAVGGDDDDEKVSKRKMKRMHMKKRNEAWFFDTATCELLHEDLEKPFSLKFLLELFLGVHIQSNEHDSVIDAISTMVLYRAILPEIKAKSLDERKKKMKSENGKKEFLKRKEEGMRRRSERRRNQNVLNNYAYNNELDRLMAQMNDAGKDNFEKQLLRSNPYRNDLKDNGDVATFIE